MSPDVLRWLLSIVVIAHGIGHVLFMPWLSSAMRVDASGQSWLLTGVLGEQVTHGVASVGAAAIAVAFVVAGAGLVAGAPWWRPVAFAAAIASAVLIALMWGGLPASSAAWALVCDAVILVGLLVARLPSRESIGA